MLIELFAGILAILILWVSLNLREKRIGGVPKVPCFPIVGSTLPWVTRGHKWIIECSQKYGDIFIVNLQGRDVYFLVGEEGNKWIFKGDNKYIVNDWPDHIQKMVGSKSLLVSPPDYHKSQRQILLQAFYPNNLQSYFEHIQKTAVGFLDKYVDLSKNNNGIDFYENIRDYAFTISSKLFLGLPESQVDKEFISIFETWQTGLGSIIILNYPFTAYGKAMKSRELLRKKFKVILEKNKQELRENQNNENFDFLKTLIQAKDENGLKFDDEDHLDQMLLFFFAGYETTSSAMSSAIAVLIERKDIYQKIDDEIRANFGENEPFEYKKLVSMEYLEGFIKEVLRCYPPIRGGGKRVIQDTQYKDHIIPKGAKVKYSPDCTHQSDEYSNAQLFDPERFLEPRKEDKKHNYMHLGFGAGIHHCIGFQLAKLMMKVFIVNMMRSYKLEGISEKKFVTFPFLHRAAIVSLKQNQVSSQ